jgi:hypothetical protein
VNGILDAVAAPCALPEPELPERGPPALPLPRRAHRTARSAAIVFVLVFSAQFAFGVWMASRGFRWGDAFYRSASALFVLHSGDPKLANIGFVWMPLPTLLNLPWAALYPVWPAVVSSGAASAGTGALCGGASAALLVVTAARLGLPGWLGWIYAAAVSLNPMIFLYAGSGMSEGVTAPFLIGAVCFLTLFWHSGVRVWIAAAGISLGLGFAAAYEAIPYGVALAAVLVAGVAWSREARPSAPLGRLRACEGLCLLLVTPAAFVAVLFIGANAMIMGDPLFFVRGAYGYASYKSAAFTGDSPDVAHDVVAVLGLVLARVWPFFIPLAGVVLVRVLDGRLWRIESLSVVVLGVSVTIGLVAPMAYVGSRMEFLRYYLYPLFAAAGWGLYEIARSHRPWRAIGVVLGGWIVASPVCMWAMLDPTLGAQERPGLMSVAAGLSAQDLGYVDPVVTRAALARYVDANVLARHKRLLLDSFQGAAIATQIPNARAGLLIMTFDRRFHQALADPDRHQISYVLVPDPSVWPQDAVTHARPRIWSGREPGFALVKRFDPGPRNRLPEAWRLFAVRPGFRVLPSAAGGAG